MSPQRHTKTTDNRKRVVSTLTTLTTRPQREDHGPIARTDNPVRVRVDRVESDERRVRTPPRDVAVGWRSERVERSEEESGASTIAPNDGSSKKEDPQETTKRRILRGKGRSSEEVNGVQKRSGKSKRKREQKTVRGDHAG